MKNKEGKLARIIAKENEHKDAMKECKKAEKAEAKGRGSKQGTEPWAIRVRTKNCPNFISRENIRNEVGQPGTKAFSIKVEGIDSSISKPTDKNSCNELV